MTDNREKWFNFLNPAITRTRLISAGLFLVGHEMLLSSIKRHPLHFFADSWNERGPVASAAYRSEVLGLDPRGKGDPIRGSIAWLRKMDAITESDEAAITAVTDARNRLAHELTGLIGGSLPEDFSSHYPTLMTLVSKIEKWWILNVEVATNPDFDDAEIDEEGITPGSVIAMDMLAQIALGEGEEAWRLHRWFEEQWPSKT